MINNRKAFTFVELIIVVTILAILGTIGFISYSGYLESVRDTNRVSTLNNIYDSLKVYYTKGKIGKPDSYVNIESSGSIIGYQGYVGKKNLEEISFTKGGYDPKDQSKYSLYMTKNRKYFQLMGFLESNENLETLDDSIAQIDTDSGKYPKIVGNKIGILTSTGGIPIQDIEPIKTNKSLDISTTTGSFISYFKDKEYAIGTGSTLSQLEDSAKVGGKKCSIVNNVINCEIEEYLFTENLKGNWNFEDWFNDQSENQDNATNPNSDIGANGVSITNDSVRGKVAYFDGDGDFLLIPDSPAFHLTNSTISFWMMHDGSPSSRQGLFGRDHNGQTDAGHFTISSYNAGYIYTRIQEKDPVHNPSTSHEATGALNTPTVWNHILVTFGSTEGFKTYINGELASYNPFEGGIDGNSNSIILGATSVSKTKEDPFTSSTYEWYKGWMDDVMIFNRALYDYEVKKLYDQQKK